MNADRVVVDTNVLISAALISSSRPRVVLDLIRSANGLLLFSDETFDELRTRLTGSKFDRYVSQAGRAVFLAQLEAVSQWISITGAKMGCRDISDDKFLETALMGEADCVITGDQDLLVMSPFHGIPIIQPSDFVNEWQGWP